MMQYHATYENSIDLVIILQYDNIIIKFMEILHWSHQIPCERSFRKPLGLPMFADLRSGSEVISL